MGEDMSEIPESDEVREEGEARNQQRLAEYLTGHNATEAAIDIKAAMSEALVDGVPASAIIADFGGEDEIKRKIGEEEYQKIFGDRAGAEH